MRHHLIREALDIYFLLDLALLERDTVRIEGAMERLDGVLASLASLEGLKRFEVTR